MRHLPAVLRRLWLPALVMVGIICGVAGLFILAFGWHRFLIDYWPLDRSVVGPNLIASITVVILVTGHNEYRTIRDAEAKGETAEEVVDDALEELMHPTQTAEQHIADDVTKIQGDSA